MQREQGSPRCPGAAGGRPGKGVSAARHSQRGGGRSPGRAWAPWGSGPHVEQPLRRLRAQRSENWQTPSVLTSLQRPDSLLVRWWRAKCTASCHPDESDRRRRNSHKARLTRGPRATPAKAGPPLAGQPVPSPAGVAGCALGPRPQEQRSLPADRNGGSQETFACAPKPSGAFARPAGVGEPVSAREMRCLPRGRDQPELRTVSASLGSDGQTDGRTASREAL